MKWKTLFRCIYSLMADKDSSKVNLPLPPSISLFCQKKKYKIFCLCSCFFVIYLFISFQKSISIWFRWIFNHKEIIIQCTSTSNMNIASGMFSWFHGDVNWQFELVSGGTCKSSGKKNPLCSRNKSCFCSEFDQQDVGWLSLKHTNL